MSTLRKSIQDAIGFKINDVQIKQAINYLNWTNSKQFSINNPNPSLLNEKYSEYLWITIVDKIQNTEKIVFSDKAINPLVELISDKNNHEKIFGKKLNLKI